MKETVSGFEVQGDWETVVDHGDRVTRALRAMDVDETALAEWEEWRPKAHERLEPEVSEKTVEQAVVEEGPGERAGATVGEDVRAAREEAVASMEVLEEDGPDDVYEKWRDALSHALRAADTAVRKGLRRSERVVYSEVMTEFAPYYFDNDLLTANLRSTTGRGDEEEFVFEVNVDDDDQKAELSRRLDADEFDD